MAFTCLTSCASSYKTIYPHSIKYISQNEDSGVTLSYKYDLLDKKYRKKETKKGVKLVALKITNNSGRDLVFGQDAILTYENGSEIYILDNERVFKSLKQSPATYLFYLLLTPLNMYTTSSNGYSQETNSTPIGLILGPGLAGGNMIAAGSANKKFKNELLDYNINGTVLKNGETSYGLIGIQSNSFDALRLVVK